MVSIRELEEPTMGSSEDELPPLTHGGRAPVNLRASNNGVVHRGVNNTDEFSSPRADSEEDELPHVTHNTEAKMDSKATSDDDSLPPLVANQDYGSESKISSDDDLPPVHGNNAPGAEPMQSMKVRSSDATHIRKHTSPSTKETRDDMDDAEDVPPLLPQKDWKHSSPMASPQACGGQESKAPPMMSSSRTPQTAGEWSSPAAAQFEPPPPKESPVPNREAAAPADPEDLRMAKSRVLSSRRLGDKQKVASALLDAAEVELRLNRLEQAMQGAIEARGIYKELFNGRGEAEALRMAVQVHAKGKRYQDAGHLAEEELALFRDVGDCRAEAIMLLAIADVKVAQEDYVSSCQSAEKALTIFQEVEDVRGQATALEACAASYAVAERWEQLILMSKEASEKFEAAGDAAGHANLLKNVAQAHVRGFHENPEKSLEVAKQLLGLCRELGNRRGEASALECISSAFLQLKDGLKEALRAVNKALAIFKDIGDQKGELSACNLLANVWLAEEKYEEAMRAQKIGVKLARELGDQRQLNDAMDIGLNVHFGNELPEKALALAEEELRLARRAKSRTREANGILKLSKVKQYQGKMTEAIRDCEQAITIFQDAGERKGEAHAHIAKAEILMEEKDSSQALSAAKEAEILLEAINDVRGVVYSLQLQTGIYMDAGQHERALQQCYKQVRVYRDVGFKELEAGAQNGVAEMLAEIKGPREALSACKKAHQMYKDINHKAGQASSLVQIAMQLANSQAPTDALRSASEGQSLAKEVGDVGLETEAMQVAAEIYMMQGSLHEAIRHSTAAVTASQEAGDQRQEAENAKKTAEVYLNVMRLQEENGRGADRRYMKEALEVIQVSRDAFDIIGDKYGEASALIMTSNIHLVDHDGEKALQTAQSALEISIALSDEVGVGNAYLTIAKAEIQNEKADAARAYVHEAQTCFKQAGDQNGLNECDQVIREAQELVPKPSIRRSQSTGRNLGRNSRDASSYDPYDDENVRDSRQRGDHGREVLSGGQPSGFGSGSRSRSMPPAEPSSPAASASSGGPGRFAEPMLDSLPLPKSLNGFRGPQVERLSDGGRALTERLLAPPKAGDLLGFGRGVGFKFGFGSPDGCSPAQGHLSDSDTQSQGPDDFPPHKLDLDRKQEPPRGQWPAGPPGGRRPMREVDGLD